jgi:hypothetical protein
MEMQMQILSEDVLTGDFVMNLAVVIAGTILCITIGVGFIFSYFKSKEKIILVLGAILTVLGLMGIPGIFYEYEKGAEVHYKAIVTDYNEVYDKGYEIIDQEGKIITLKKED